MISLLEQGVADFLKAFFEANDISATVHPGTTSEAIPPNDSLVVASFKECPHDVGPLYRGMLEVVISTPATVQKTVEDHRILVADVEEAFDPESAEELSGSVQAAAGCAVNGWFYQGPRESIQDERWETTLGFVLGIERLAN